jgi:mannose-1-phosphate guanylyltransferase
MEWAVMTRIDRAQPAPAVRESRNASLHGETWAVVLAAGEGRRLRSLTTDASGTTVPKQFCSLRDGPSLLHEALQRAETIAEREHICAVVARQHARWWGSQLDDLVARNLIVQPENRGTAIGILLALLHVIERDASAVVVLLPSDQHVANEAVMCVALERSVNIVRERRSKIVLLGIAPEEPDSELGYIVPAAYGIDGLSAVTRLVEKPRTREARMLIERGALWNTFIMTARALSLLELFTGYDRHLVERMLRAVRRDGRPVDAGRPSAMAALYPNLPTIDFSQHVAPGREKALTVLRVPSCGWTDLGTPQRVGKTLAERTSAAAPRKSTFGAAGHLSLEQRWLRG